MCCFHPKRRAELVTHRLRICPWCINVLHQNKSSPEQVVARHRARLHAQRGTRAIDRHIDDLEARKTPAPAGPALPDDVYRDMALFKARAEEGVLLGLYRTLVDGRQRRRRAYAIEQALRASTSTAQAAAQAAHRLQQQRIDAEIGLHRVQRDRIDGLVEAEVDAHFRAMRAPYPTVLVEVRLMRAYWLGLVNFDGRGSPRLGAEAGQALRAEVLGGDRRRCVLCASSSELHAHQVVSLGTCGTNHPANLATLCADCHARQHPFKVKRRERGAYSPYQ